MRLNLFWTLSLAITCVLVIDHSFAGTRESCAERRAELVRQIDRADVANNTYRRAGLEQALANVERYCREPDTDDDRQRAINEAEDDVRRKQNLLKAAHQYGDVKVIDRHQLRLARAEARLQRLKDE